MHTFSKRRLTSAFAMAAVGLGVALSSTGCGAGQISQTANQEPAVNGASVNFGKLALRNVQIVYPATDSDEVFGNGGPFKISFVISNNSPDHYFRLDKITAPQGTVSIDARSDDLVIAPNGSLHAGSPVAQLTANNDDDTSTPITVTLRNAGKTVASGLTTKLVFTFSTASVTDAKNFVTVTGDTSVDTPVDVGTYLERQDKVREAEAPEDTH